MTLLSTLVTQLWDWFEPYLNDPEEFNIDGTPQARSTALYPSVTSQLRLFLFLRVSLAELHIDSTLVPLSLCESDELADKDDDGPVRDATAHRSGLLWGQVRLNPH